ncbi:RimJ/RimL family protein N-acetyltransferase [Cytobacillus purgationiresistens]|uniref:RimJ/RimL family protein N-acetyltransferase n=1 Tax=Cytobacillus purgationiresistens TaxID=863449 RepID=A0ABU0APK4_9BACI|nr:RimJ/RimL family protein N-acetyltransferase [Cytobacillus purgationiresistens]
MREMFVVGDSELNLNKIWLKVEIDNEKAIKSYKRIGYVEEDLKTRPIKEWEIC